MHSSPSEGVRLEFRRDWAAAYRSLRGLLTDTQDTAHVFAIIRALAGRSLLRGYNRLLATSEGGRIAYERIELAVPLADSSWMERFAEGSVGAAYRSFIEEGKLSPQGLVKVSRKRQGTTQDDGDHLNRHPYAWFGRRVRDTHDIWHVLTGYGRDPLGDACLVAFTYAQTGGLGWAFLAVGGAIHKRKDTKLPLRRAVWEGYCRGRRTGWLLGEDYERLLAEGLEAARTRLRLTAPTVYEAIPANYRSSPTRALRTLERTVSNGA